MSVLKALLMGGYTDGWRSAEASGQKTAVPPVGSRDK